MNKIKNFFFNKIEKNKPTTFLELFTSLMYGGLKIILLMVFNSILRNLFIPDDFTDPNFSTVDLVSALFTLLILIYILLNRIPNQFKIFRNYFNTNTFKKVKKSNIMFEEKTSQSGNLNFDSFRNRIYFKNGKKKVHYTFEQLKIKGNLYTDDLIWYEGLKDWTKVSNIYELSSIALNQPPLTTKEKNILCLKKSLKPSIIIYVVFSIILGVSTGLLEKFQYEKFFKEVNTNSIKYQKEDDELEAKNRREYGNYQNYNSKPSFSSYSNMRQDELYATNEDYTKFTRWSSYLTQRGTDQEQISYNATYKFLFRPYKAIIGHANLSREERTNIGVLLTNFTLSAFFTNLLLLSFIILPYFLKNKKEL